MTNSPDLVVALRPSCGPPRWTGGCGSPLRFPLRFPEELWHSGTAPLPTDSHPTLGSTGTIAKAGEALPPEAALPAETTAPATESDSSTEPAGALTCLLQELARTPECELGHPLQKGLSPGEVVGRFELLREIGRGGFGIVYEARDVQLGRLVAFKALRPGRTLDQEQVEGLRREAEAAAQLNHPNVVTVHDFGTCPAGPYLIMELLGGATVSHRLESGPLPPCEVARIGADVARALVHAHAAGIIHRDLKPSNVFLCRDRKVKVLDFGLACMLGTSGVQGGTPGHMGPEQCRGGKEDERTDLFSLGVLLYRMLTAQMPFEVVNGVSAVCDDAPPPDPRGEHVPVPLSALVRRLLAKDPAGRPSSALEVADDLAAIAHALDPAVIARRQRRRRGRIAVAALVLLAGLGGAMGGGWMRTEATRLREQTISPTGQATVRQGERGVASVLLSSGDFNGVEQELRTAIAADGRGESDR